MSASSKEVLRGFALLALINLLAAGLAWIGAVTGSGVAAVLVYGIGVVQILWALPLQLHAFRRGRRSFGIGLVIAAALTLLLNAACFALVLGAADFH